MCVGSRDAFRRLSAAIAETQHQANQTKPYQSSGTILHDHSPQAAPTATCPPHLARSCSRASFELDLTSAPVLPHPRHQKAQARQARRVHPRQKHVGT